MKFTEEQIATRIEESQKKYLRRKEQQKEYQLWLKNGRAFIHKNREKILFFPITEQIGCAIELSGTGEGFFAYSFRNPKDNVSFRVARGVFGQKLENGADAIASPMSQEIFLAAKEGKEEAKGFLLTQAAQLLTIGILEGYVQAPTWAQRLVLSQF